MRADSRRWTEVAASPFPHEREGLAAARELLPDRAPFHAWSNVEFRDRDGKWYEVDLLVLGEGRLHLVELQYYSGLLRGDSYRWLRPGHPVEDSPVLLARRKAQRLKGLLSDALRDLPGRPDPREVLPYVQQAVFLHDPSLVCDLAPADRADLFGLDGAQATSGLPGLSRRLLEPPAGGELPRTLRDDGRLLRALIDRIGFARRREREVGSWRLVGPAGAEGPGWQDWPAEQRVSREPATIRFFVTTAKASAEERQRIARRAHREYELTRQLRHVALRVPRDIVDGELGTGLVYPRDDRWQRLDLWLAGQPDGVPLDARLQVVRGVAEAMGYAHRSQVVHRGLTPAAVLVHRTDDGTVRVQLGDWQVVGRATGRATDRTTTTAVTRLAALLGTGGSDPGSVARVEAYRAPEGLSTPNADRVRLDVFALGALTSFVLTGRPPAPDRLALRERLTRDDGLDLAADLPEVGTALRTLVLAATRPPEEVSSPSTTPSVRQPPAASAWAGPTSRPTPVRCWPGRPPGRPRRPWPGCARTPATPSSTPSSTGWGNGPGQPGTRSSRCCGRDGSPTSSRSGWWPTSSPGVGPTPRRGPCWRTPPPGSGVPCRRPRWRPGRGSPRLSSPSC